MSRDNPAHARSKKGEAHARSKNGEAKKARRRKRQAARSVNRVSAGSVDQLADIPDAVVADLAEFDERITGRGWTFDEEESDEDYAIWVYEPSAAEVTDGVEVTALWLEAAEDGEVVHGTFVGTVEHFGFTHGELFIHLDTIEGFRAGDPLPAF